MKSTINDIIKIIERNYDILGIVINNGASMEDIYSFEQTIQFSLPDDFVIFYRFCNGFRRDNEMIFNFLSLQGIIDEWKLSKEFTIAEYMIFSETWYLKGNELDKNNYSIYSDRDIILTNSLAEFLHRFLIGGVMELSEWGEELFKNNR